ncbi:Fe-S oxidoreductase [Bacillus coahuilensis m2-6]|uniref:B12-binding domain-containing radical SAM protein n=1 Tax=Bacillus coahuilensis TaxID=408580 RepID=UPI0007503C3F|nr:B12-binding domain-containing radical SAM protein [Bacillus coahuilensis]KUP08903.1 Fe-S oxidoreductase [Bacillus coahuilensis m2-6]
MNVVLSTLNAKYIHTNLAIRYLKSYAAPEFEVQLSEYTIKDPSMNIVTDLFHKQPDVLGFSCYIWNIEEIIRVISMIKKLCPNVIIVLGGPEVTYDVNYWLERIPDVDYIIIGEGELSFKQLLNAIKNQEDVSTIPGLAYRTNEQISKLNPQSNKLDLRELPSPFRFKEDLPHLSKRVIYIETSRGCPFRCQFCLSSIEVGVRYFDREKVKEDIRYLMENGAKTIKFVDRTFNISRSYAMEMFQFLIDEHKPGTVFQFEITADIMRPEVIQFLNDHAPNGLFRFEIGVQSTNDETNDLVMRKQNWDKLTRTVTMVKQGKKIDQHLDLIAGLPEEDYNSFRKTFNDVFALRPEELQLGFLKLLRGTGLRVRSEDFGYVYMDHAPYEMLSNRVLSFSEVARIKQVEDVLEKYWNDHRMDETIEYIVTHEFNTPFDFFQEFGMYWEAAGWSRIGHQLEDLFIRLYEFLETRNTGSLSIIKDLMTYDYFANQKHKPRKSWSSEILSKEEQQSVYLSILNSKNEPEPLAPALKLTEKELNKHTIVEKMSFDLQHYLEKKEIVNASTYMITYFDPTSHTVQFFNLPAENLNTTKKE